ncbi:MULTISPECIES: nitrous oxide reductase family maturation protein NosD [unclassified Mesorhizobium]|uniref:nitrous oxide reductase family maturation protein NosD n=1 Tax=unclassified Mesorhizobium TaxID=325217 RepID=UPI001093A34B|nr:MULTISPECIES: nitrous oxide reductase family maturation protein NosD [unclassified Mesorhizobium]TGQ72948.1 nitrous oxide reductase family maturation protein NosD [bacterium M00.F.Ca.ET.205.01.1.1]TGU53704.1 nitrous oxide reductase family maturation protein NosD [bacterium M00.F.Ca.ET.152.01.1.1]TGV37203.1 nitrous oxide reductase family maturation protein NosD [Mesorhizobium sp. M00.F.Ca.ET.186.01.1.1]TGZ39428.1 nitrous oxide reductase family maturation protein NosD [bacterium M00.F.Ca.ET.16
MARLATLATLGMAAFLVAIPGSNAGAAEIAVPADETPLQTILDAAAPGDVLLLATGRHRGPVSITKRVTLQGQAGAIVEGDGQGSVITVETANAAVRGLEIVGSGSNLDAMDAGVFVKETAKGAIVEGNAILGNLYGIYLHGAAGAVARGNRIEGMRTGRTNQAGNGVSVWNAPGAKVVGNQISFGRDGIFATASKHNEFSANIFHDVRFAIHYMYTNDSVISDNVSVGNVVGYAIMYSSRLRVTGNLSDGDRDNGLLFNYANGSEISGNVVRGRRQPIGRWASNGQRFADTDGLPAGDADGVVTATGAITRLGPEKCVFIYNANKNRFRGNRFEGCEIGVHFTAGSEGNEMAGNAFIRNRNQVKYVGTRYLDWSSGGRGNYWSDNPAFDLNGDGIGDNSYRPNDMIDKVLWTAPAAKVLVNSPAVQVIRWAQTRFPAVFPGGVVDSHPLMKPADTEESQ